MSLSRTCPRLLSVICTNKCGENRHNVTTGFIKSPGYPRYVFPDMRCTWRFTANGHQTAIAFQFLDLNLYEQHKGDFDDEQPEQFNRLV